METERERKKRRLNDSLHEDSENRELINNNNNNNNNKQSHITPLHYGRQRYYFRGKPYGFIYIFIFSILVWFYQNLNMNTYDIAKGMFLILFLSYCITVVFCF